MLGMSTLGIHYPGVTGLKDLKGDTEVRDIMTPGNSRVGAQREEAGSVVPEEPKPQRGC